MFVYATPICWDHFHELIGEEKESGSDCGCRSSVKLFSWYAGGYIRFPKRDLQEYVCQDFLREICKSTCVRILS